MKPCSRCGETKALSEFYAHAKTRLRVTSWCKSCYRQNQLERRWWEANPEAARANNKRYRETHREELRQRQRARNAARRPRRICEACGESIAQTKRMSARFCSESCRKRAEIRRENYQRRSRLKAQFVEVVKPSEVYVRDDGVCGICGEAADRADFHLDHIVPLAKGEPHSYANVQVAHPYCNRRKGATLVKVVD